MGFDESTILRASKIDRTAPKITETAAKAAYIWHDIVAEILDADSQWLLPPPPISSNVATKKYEGQKTIISRAHLHQIYRLQEIMLKYLYTKVVQMRFTG